MPLAISASKQNEKPSTLLEVLPTERTSLHHCLSGMSQKGPVEQLLATPRCCLHGTQPAWHAEPSVTRAQFSCPWSPDRGEPVMKPQVQAGKEKVMQQKWGILATSCNLFVPSELLGGLFQ